MPPPSEDEEASQEYVGSAPGLSFWFDEKNENMEIQFEDAGCRD